MQPPSANRSSFWQLPLWQVLLLALILRGGALAARKDSLHKDPDQYRAIAERFAKTGAFTWKGYGDDLREPYAYSTAFRPPLYPLILAAIAFALVSVTPLGVALLHLVLGVASVGLVWWIALHWPLGPAFQKDKRNRSMVATLAALLVAADPLLLNQSTLVMTETLALFFTLLVLYCFTRAVPASETSSNPPTKTHWLSLVLLGVSVGVASLARPTFLPWLAILAVLSVFSSGDGSRLLRGMVILISGVLVLLPWGIRNQLVFGKPILTTTHGGYTLWLANNPEVYAYEKAGQDPLPWSSDKLDAQVKADQKQVFEKHLATAHAHSLVSTEEYAARQTELEMDALLRQKALAQIQADPEGFIRATRNRLVAFFRPAPNRLSLNESRSTQIIRYTIGVWYVAIYTLAIWGLKKLRPVLFSPQWLAGLSLVFLLAATHSLYFSNVRMRAPIVGVLALLAAVGLTALLDWLFPVATAPATEENRA